MSKEYKIIFLYFKRNLTYQEISEVLDVSVTYVAETIAVEYCETKRQELVMFEYVQEEYIGKVKLN